MERKPLTQSDVLFPGPRHGEAWDRLRQVCLDYNVEPPTLPELFDVVSPPEFAEARDTHGQPFGDVGLWLMQEIGPRLGLPSSTWDDDALDQILMMPRGGIINIEAGYFIVRPRPE